MLPTKARTRASLCQSPKRQILSTFKVSTQPMNSTYFANRWNPMVLFEGTGINNRLFQMTRNIKDKLKDFKDNFNHQQIAYISNPKVAEIQSISAQLQQQST